MVANPRFAHQHTRMTNIQRIVDYGERIIAICLSLPFVLMFLQYLPLHPSAFAMMFSELLSVFFVVIRKPGEVSTKPYPVAIAIVGTAAPLLARPGGLELLPTFFTAALMIGGATLAMSAKLFLNRSFGLVAANRGIKRGGPYRFVRHPMYLGYMVAHAGFLLSSFSWALAGTYLATWTALILRIIEEEKILLKDPAYQDFARAVPRRLLPGF